MKIEKISDGNKTLHKCKIINLELASTHCCMPLWLKGLLSFWSVYLCHGNGKLILQNRASPEAMYQARLSVINGP